MGIREGECLKRGSDSRDLTPRRFASPPSPRGLPFPTFFWFGRAVVECATAAESLESNPAGVMKPSDSAVTVL